MSSPLKNDKKKKNNLLFEDLSIDENNLNDKKYESEKNESNFNIDKNWEFFENKINLCTTVIEEFESYVDGLSLPLIEKITNDDILNFLENSVKK